MERMNGPKKAPKPDSTIIVKPGEVDRERAHAAAAKVSATQILKADPRNRKTGDSSVILSAERIRKSGLGVAMKFALVISVTITVFMALFGAIVYTQVSKSMNTEIDAAGIQAVRALAAPDVDSWNRFHGAYAGTDYGGYEAEIARGERKIPRGALTDEQEKLSNLQIAANEARLAGLIGSDERILDAVITNPERNRMLRSARGSDRLAFVSANSHEEGGVRIEYGAYTPPSGQSLAARSFIAPIKDKKGAEVGKAQVVLSEQSIQETLATMRMQIVLLTLVFIVVGIVVSFVMGRGITRPLAQLTGDVQIIAQGNLDHRPHVRSRDEIGVLSQTVDMMARSLKSAQQAEVEHLKQKHQLSVALEIQSNLFPKSLPKLETYEIEAHYRPGPEVGGDYYDVIELPDGRLFLMVASASGKGIPAAMLTVMARSFIAATAEKESSPAAIFKAVNRLLSPDLRRGMYVTALAAVLDPKSGTLTVANAGHNPLLRYEATTKGVAPVHSDGIALGFDKGPVFERSLRETEVPFNPGDRIVLCTPGVFGIKDKDGRELGEANFNKLIAREGAKTSGAFVNLVVHVLDRFTDGGGSIDTDITFITLKRIV